MFHPLPNRNRLTTFGSSPKADTFFNTFVEQAVDEIVRRVERSQLNVSLPTGSRMRAITEPSGACSLKIIIFSGGFSESPYFQRVVREHLDKAGRTILFARHPT